MPISNLYNDLGGYGTIFSSVLQYVFHLNFVRLEVALNTQAYLYIYMHVQSTLDISKSTFISTTDIIK